MNEQDIGFPSFGELVRTIYNIAGILPAKHGELDNAKRKRIQKSLQRLAHETCPLDETLARMTQQLGYLIAGAVEQAPLFLAIGEILFDWFEVYRRVMAEEGSYLSPRETMKYFLQRFAVPRIVVSLAKHTDRFSLDDEGVFEWPEGGFGFIPRRTGDRLAMPLETAMRWIYKRLGTSISRFHLIEDQQTKAIDELSLRNAHNWLSNKTLPSWPELDRAFALGFDQMALSDSPTLQSGSAERIHLRSVLFIARACTAVAREIVSAYGEGFLEELVADFLDETRCAGEERRCLASAYAASNLHFARLQEPPPTKNEFTQHWWRDYSDRALEAGDFVMRYEVTDEALEWMLPRLGPLAIRQALAFYRRPAAAAPPDGFMEAVLDGLALRQSAELSPKAIDQWAAKAGQSTARVLLPWMEPWLRGTILSRADHPELALPHFIAAFERARYCAGARQYLIVNQLVQIAARALDRKAFDRAVAWASYAGIELRLLRGAEPTPAALDNLFEIQSRMRWADD